jgi:hypothetical protein
VSGFDPTLCLTVPGRLVLGPTNLALAYPFGGTPVGIVSRARLVREQSYALANSEALGRDGVSAYGGRFKASVSAVLVQRDKTILNALYASSSTSAGGYAGANVLSLPLPGRSLPPGFVPASAALLFVADDQDNQPSLLVYAPILVLQAKDELDLVLNKPLEEGFVAYCGLDGTNRDFQWALLSDIAL